MICQFDIDLMALRVLFPRTSVFKYPVKTAFHLVKYFSSNMSVYNARKGNEKCSAEEVKQFIDSIDTVLTDCDGVLWVENNEIKGAHEVFNTFRKLGKRVFFITNNSTKVREDFVVKARGMGFIADEEDILSTAYLTANYLKSLNFKKKAYVVGSSGITRELDKVGIRHIGTGPDPVENIATLVHKSFKIDPEVGAVIVGFDEHFSYAKMLKAATYANNPDCIFIGTNRDERFPMKTGVIVPGTGCFIRAIETCAERDAFIIGKPDKYVSQAIIENFQVDPARTLMIGDRANTDILLGTRCGFKTLMVLTGVNSEDDIKKWQASDSQDDKDLIANLYAPSIHDLLPYMD